MNWLARLSLLLLIFQLATTKSIPKEASDEEENDDDNYADEKEEAPSNIPIEQPIVQNAMTRGTVGTLEEFIDQEKGWMTVFMKHLALHQKWATTVAGVAINAHFYGMVAALVFRFMKEAQNKNGGVFAEIRNKLDKRIAYHINKDKIYRAQKIFDNQIAAITAKMHWREGTHQAGYQYEDLLELRTYLPDFLPQEPSVDYDEEWFQLMANYLVLYKNFYNGLIANGKIHKCVFVIDWNHYLKDTFVKSIGRLTYSYFSHLQKTDTGGRLIGEAWLQFEDHIPEKKVMYEAKFTEVQTNVLNQLSRDVGTKMMNIIGEAYNTLLSDFTPDEIEYCEGASNVTKGNITYRYPRSCFGRGTIDGSMKQCDLPCGRYKFKKSEPYCIYFHGRDPVDTEYKGWTLENQRIDSCQGSGPDYWRTCARIPPSMNIAQWDREITRAHEYFKEKDQNRTQV